MGGVKTQLYATPGSHFARKIRILLSEFQAQHELIYVSSLLSSSHLILEDIRF